MNADLEHCRAAIRTGSLSFHTASLLLPQRVRDPALVLYAFCRLADDAVDLQQDKTTAVLSLRDRLEAAYRGQPRNTPVDRAFAVMIEAEEMPRALPDALLEGLAWDAMGRRYETFDDLMDYCARVASAVGAMMCVLMKARGADARARATDLGLAMQMTNIARDIGEDAHEGRLYLPLEWMDEAGIDINRFHSDPQPTEATRALTRRLLRRADDRYASAVAGISVLPASCRIGIMSALLIYRAIGGEITKAEYDSITRRARTSRRRKLGLLLAAMGRVGLQFTLPQSAVLYRKPHQSCAFLVEAATREQPAGALQTRADALVEALAQLEASRRARQSGLLNDASGVT